MSWEVRTMRSATSFFNLTLLKKNVQRFWFIWAVWEDSVKNNSNDCADSEWRDVNTFDINNDTTAIETETDNDDKGSNHHILCLCDIYLVNDEHLHTH